MKFSNEIQRRVRVRVRVVVLSASFNNISAISWRSVLLVEGTADLSQVTDKLYYIMLYLVHLALVEFELTTLVVIHTDCICSYESNCHTNTTTTEPIQRRQMLA